MDINNPNNQPVVTLDQLLDRGDVWRGQSKLVTPQLTLDTGYAALNGALLNGGWPVGSFVEICQQGFSQAEWLLLTPALVSAGNGFIVLLNPPLEPFAPTLVNAGFDLERILVIRTNDKPDFLASFVELTRAMSCDAVMAWQPKESFTYTELRKCLLAGSEGHGLYVMFRPAGAQQQSSPAALRLVVNVHAKSLQLTIFKQKGMLKNPDQAIQLTLPDRLSGFLPFHNLHQTFIPGTSEIIPLSNTPKRKLGSVIPLRRG